MMTLVFIIVLQLAIAGVVIVVLKRLLDRELEQAAIEKLMSLKTNATVKIVHIYYTKPLSLNVEQTLTGLVKNKFVDGEIAFEQLRDLKGGLIIKVDDEVLDFSLSSRLENFWS